MYFALLPPEINSARMYSGPGAAPMLTAAAAWDALAVDVSSTATSYASVVSGLTDGPWLGPSAAAMAAAAAPLLAWLQATAATAEQAGPQAKAAAAAFEAAFAMTVPPPVIAANRALLLTLVATNVLGQNTPAIAATETHYAQMWAQDAAAMTGYAAAAASAATLTPFGPPPAGLAGQFGALLQSVVQSIAADVVEPFSTLSQLISAVPPALQGLGVANPSLSGLASLLSLAVRIATTPATYAASAFGGRNVGNLLAGLAALGNKLDSIRGGLGALAPGGPGLGALAPGGPVAAVSASMGQARTVAALSVPQTWAGTAPAVPPAAAAPATHAAAATAGAPGMARMPVSGIAVARPHDPAGAPSRSVSPPVSVIPHFPAAG